MNAAIHWAMVDDEGTLMALVRSEHFVQHHVVCDVVRKALDLGPVFFLIAKPDFSIPEWETWFAFGIPAFDIVLVNRGTTSPSELEWAWQEITP